MLPKQIEQLGQVTARKIDDAAVSLRGEIDLKLGDLSRENEETRAKLSHELDNLDSALAKRLDDVIEKQSIAHALEIQSLAEQLKAQEIFEGQLTQRLAEIKDGEKGEQGFQGESGIDGLDKPLLEPVDITDKGYPKNTLGLHEGGLWISTKETVGSPESDPHAWSCILDSMTTMSIDLQEDHTFRLSVRMATGKLIESDLHIPYPEHKGIWEEGDYKKGEIVTKGSSFWQAMEDTSGEPPGNGWKQILSAPRGKQGPAGKSIEGPQGKPGRNGLDAKLPEGFIDDLIALASERKAFEDGRSGAEVITSFRGYFMPGEAYSVGDVVNFDDSLYLCVSGGSYKSIAQSAGAFELLIGVPKVAYVPFMHWQGEWTAKSYSPGMTVRDGPWTMVALRDTSERAGPRATGDKIYTGDGATYTPFSNVAKNVVYGTRVLATNSAYFITGYSIGVISGFSYRVFFVTDSTSSNPIFTELAEFVATATETLEFSVGQKPVGAERSFDIVAVITEPNPTPTTWVGNWNYVTPNNENAPGVGVCSQANQLPQSFRFNKTDNDTGDRSVELLALTAGDTFTDGATVWGISAVNDNGNWVELVVSPAVQSGGDGVKEFTFSTTTPTAIDVGRDLDFYAGNNAVKGFFQLDGAWGSATQDDNSYAVNIQYQAADVSLDWEMVSYTGEYSAHQEPALSATDVAWVQASASPFDSSSVVTTDASWTEVGRKPIADGEAFKARIAIDGKRLDSTEYHASEWIALAYNNGGITDYLQKDIELGIDLSVRTTTDGDDLVIEVMGKNNQEWGWAMTAFYREVS